jgi:hypothetical protein
MQAPFARDYAGEQHIYGYDAVGRLTLMQVKMDCADPVSDSVSGSIQSCPTAVSYNSFTYDGMGTGPITRLL